MEIYLTNPIWGDVAKNSSGFGEDVKVTRTMNIISSRGCPFSCGYCHFAMAGCKFHHVPKVLYSVRHHGGDRKTGQHTDERYKNLLEESKRCAWRARDWLNAD